VSHEKLIEKKDDEREWRKSERKKEKGARNEE
jgi:hypothetical protein